MAKASIAALTASAAGLAAPALAGPPFETDDPAPTSFRHWELYLFADGGGRGAEFDGAAGLDVNYGLRPDLQVTATVPVQLSSTGGADIAVETIDLSVKYRFLTAPRDGWSAAIAPIMTVPLAQTGEEPRRPALRVPLWVGWSTGRWSVYGGGGRLFVARAEGRDLWFGGLVVTGGLRGGALLGAEVTRRGAGQDGGAAETGIALGCMIPLADPIVLHVAGGPRFGEGELVRSHFYVSFAAFF